MSYVRKWVPPSIPLRDSLPAWKLICQDIHDALLLAGLTQTATAGQLDIAGVAALPADNSYAGFCEYAFSDALQATAPVIIKLEFGCGAEGLTSGSSSYCRSRTLRIRGTVTFKGVASRTFPWPQEANNSSGVTTQLTNYGTSYLTYDGAKGFLGFVYGAGSRNKPHSHSSGSYYGATLTIFLQRDTDPNGAPNANGLAIYSPSLTVNNTSSLWTNGVIPTAFCQYLSGSGASAAYTTMATRIGGAEAPVIPGQVNVQEMFYAAPELKPFPWMVTYTHNGLPEGTEFDLEVFPGTTHKFIGLGNETNIGTDSIIGQHGAIAMLFE